MTNEQERLFDILKRHIYPHKNAEDAVNALLNNDILPVIRCKDCGRFNNGCCTIKKDSWGATLKVGLHDFCSDASRRK